jgi:2-polyprenyl-6-methoxyphenol hydroxylase-like FAD-dependent oxidoreductase
MQAEVIGLIEDGGRVAGVQVKTPAGQVEHRADLVVGADGRHSTVRASAGLEVEEYGAPMDVLWFRISRRSSDPADSMGRFEAGQIFVLIARGEHWQCGYVIPKGSIERIHRGGIEAFRESVAKLVPFLRDRVGEIAQWDDVKPLTVQVDRLKQWYRPGLMCIGDAAHAMSPVAGVGINLAVQDAVAAANVLAGPLREGQITTEHLRQVQRRRELPTRVTQKLQLLVQNRVITRVLGSAGQITPPLALRLLSRVAPFRRLAGRLVGMGVRPEHVRTPEVVPRSPAVAGLGGRLSG